MKWRSVAASVAGTSHTERGEGCQDDCWAASELDEAGPFLSVFVADGAGSASLGGEGARLAVEAAVAYLNQVREGDPLDVVVRGCYAAARARLAEEAEKRETIPRELACTFLGVLSSSTASAAVQIGDGAIVVDVGDGLTIPIAPMNGDYINTTRFLVDEDADDRVAIVSFDRPMLRVGVVSDGVQSISTNLAQNTPHEPFFARFFRTLESDEALGKEDELQASLAAFLASDAVNARTDDDKTLALAIALP